VSAAGAPPGEAATTARDADRPGGDGRRPRRARRRRLIGAALALAAVALALAVADPFDGSGAANGSVADNATPTSLATVTRQPLSSQQDEDGTLTYAGSYSVVNEAQGTLTALPSVGAVVGLGDVLYRVADRPVVLLYGHTPAYRALSEGLEGPDVRELNTNLVGLGYATRAALDPTSDYFSYETAYALERLQAKLGVRQTGTLELGQAVFLPGPLRIVKVMGTLGAQAPPGVAVAQASSTARQVVVDLNAAQQGALKVGDRVTITLPSNATTPGAVSAVGTVATTPSSKGGEPEGSPTIEVDVAPLHPRATGHLDQAPVRVSIVTASVPEALAVPVDALLALAGGGYAVEHVQADGVHRLIPVALGLFDDAAGLVQVSGPGLAAGQRVVVPAE
jgi:peptidoglycan hydrolase-like protein with peptidoglycan-binding domain